MTQICPYCQSRIKSDSESVICIACHIPHHKECYDFNGGCTTYGCINNPNRENEVAIEDNDSEINSDALRDHLIPPPVTITPSPPPEPLFVKTITCPKCRRENDEHSVFCKHCGYALQNSYRHPPLPPPDIPVKKRASEKLPVIMMISGLLLLAALTFTGYYIYKNIDQHFKSVDYTVEKTIDDWISTWEKKDIVKYRTFLTDDYEYIDPDGKTVNLADRMKRLEWTFQNYKNIKIKISDIKIYKDSDTTSDLKVVFKQNYDSDQYKAIGTKTLRLYRANPSDKWRIYREFFEE